MEKFKFLILSWFTLLVVSASAQNVDFDLERMMMDLNGFSVSAAIYGTPEADTAEIILESGLSISGVELEPTYHVGKNQFTRAFLNFVEETEFTLFHFMERNGVKLLFLTDSDLTPEVLLEALNTWDRVKSLDNKTIVFCNPYVKSITVRHFSNKNKIFIWDVSGTVQVARIGNVLFEN